MSEVPLYPRLDRWFHASKLRRPELPKAIDAPPKPILSWNDSGGYTGP